MSTSGLIGLFVGGVVFVWGLKKGIQEYYLKKGETSKKRVKRVQK